MCYELRGFEKTPDLVAWRHRAAAPPGLRAAGLRHYPGLIVRVRGHGAATAPLITLWRPRQTQPRGAPGCCWTNGNLADLVRPGKPGWPGLAPWPRACPLGSGWVGLQTLLHIFLQCRDDQQALNTETSYITELHEEGKLDIFTKQLSFRAACAASSSSSDRRPSSAKLT